MSTFTDQELQPILYYFYQWEKEKPHDPFLRQPFGTDWTLISWQEAGDQARRIAAALLDQGLQPGDKVGTLSKNCYHWVIADLAIMMAGLVSTPFYPNLTAAQLTEVLEASDAKALFVGKLDDWESQQPGVPDGVTLIRFPHYPGNAEVSEGLAWEELLQQYKPLAGNPTPGLHDLWTILFTSGTTGTPKGVMHSYYAPAALLYNEELNGNLKIFAGDEHRFFSYLPLNHIAERIIVEVAALRTGGTISFAESLETFAANLQQTQPTLFMAVPRIWTKFQLGILAKMPEKRLRLLLKIPLLKKVIKRKIRQALGLDQARIMLTGAAPTPDSVKDFFKLFDLYILEVYAMTENCGGCTLMPIEGIKSSTVGRPLPNVNIRIDPDTGEVLAKAPWNMLGYYKSEELTQKVLEDGWMHTGDQGTLDADGYLRITGRVSDTFKSAKGKFIVPAPMEWGFSKSSLIEQVCVVGLAQPQPLALAVLSEIGLASPREEVTAELTETLQAVNADLPNFEKIKSVIVMREPWSVENGILTPTLKIRRSELNHRFQERFNTWSSQEQAVIWD